MTPRYPNKYNLPDDEIEEDQHVRAYYRAKELEQWAKAKGEEQRDRAENFRDQAEAERQHVEEIRRRRK